MTEANQNTETESKKRTPKPVRLFDTQGQEILGAVRLIFCNEFQGHDDPAQFRELVVLETVKAVSLAQTNNEAGEFLGYIGIPSTQPAPLAYAIVHVSSDKPREIVLCGSAPGEAAPASDKKHRAECVLVGNVDAAKLKALLLANGYNVESVVVSRVVPRVNPRKPTPAPAPEAPKSKGGKRR